MSRRRVPVTLALLLGLALLGVGAPPPTAGASSAECTVIPKSPKQVCGRFLEYWQANGGLAQQGLAITEEFTEVNPTDGKPYLTQYFERARFEYHPENAAPYDVLLGLVGREQVQAKYPGGTPTGIVGDPLGANCVSFPETGKLVCGAFLTYWQEHGGLAQQGLPLTSLFLETNPTNGQQYPTQYFERARFEYHAENVGTPFVVLLGLLGREQFQAKYPNGVPSGPAPSAPPASSPSPAPLPPAPSPSPAPTTANYQVTATVSDGSPTRNERVTVTATLTNNGQGVAGATLDATWHYKTTTSYCSGGPSGSDGRVSCVRDISSASPGYTVVVGVVVTYQGQTFTTQTSFTPR